MKDIIEPFGQNLLSDFANRAYVVMENGKPLPIKNIFEPVWNTNYITELHDDLLVMYRDIQNSGEKDVDKIHEFLEKFEEYNKLAEFWRQHFNL